MAEEEPACEHIFVPVITKAPLSPPWRQRLIDWVGAPGKRIILPALAPGLSPSQVFAGTPVSLSRVQLVQWGGDPLRLASLVSQRAMHGARPALFISYRRQEAAAIADQIFDEMSHRGFRVFLDRFSGTAGRLFPQELAEELADRDVVLVLETPGILQSRWTMWEIAFARAYRLGLLAMQWPGAPSLRGIADRIPIKLGGGSQLSTSDLKAAADFVERGHAIAALTRRAFYEALVEFAALSKKGTVQFTGDGVLEVFSKKGTSGGLVVASGRPGCLAEVHRLARAAASSGKPALLLAGQHQHLRPDAQADLIWLAGRTNVDLVGRAVVYNKIRALI